MWEIFRSGGFYLIHRKANGKLYFRMTEISVTETYNIQDNIRELRETVLDEAHQQAAVKGAESIINATNKQNI